MSPQLNHTIVWCRDQKRSAAFLTTILGLPDATPYGRFLVAETDNGVSLDYAETSDRSPASTTPSWSATTSSTPRSAGSPRRS